MEPETSIDRCSRSEPTRNIVARIEFVLHAALRDYVDADFVHSITGRIVAEACDGGEEDAGRIQASLVQFSAALDHGISTARLGDGITGEIAEYWEYIFDPETGYVKEEIQTEYEVASLDLLIMDYIEVYPKFRRLGIGVFAINRTIDVFGAACGLIACKPLSTAIHSCVCERSKGSEKAMSFVFCVRQPQRLVEAFSASMLFLVCAYANRLGRCETFATQRNGCGLMTHKLCLFCAYKNLTRSCKFMKRFGVPDGILTRVTAVKVNT